MNISKSQVDDLNAVITIQVTEEDYSNKVTQTLKDYKKKANIPGFRKGNIPMGLIRKQYGKAVVVDEVNKLIQESLFNYLKEEKIAYLGNPIPKQDHEVNWDAKDFTFDFELGLAPEFEVSFGDTVPDYLKVKVTDSDIEEQITRIRTQLGTTTEQEKVSDTEQALVGVFQAEVLGEEGKRGYFKLEDVQEDKRALFLDKKPTEAVEVVLSEIFAQDAISKHIFGLEDDALQGVQNETISFQIEKVNETVPCAIDQALFDKMYPEQGIETEEAFRARLKQDGEKEFENQSDQKFLDDVSKAAIDATEFELPENFLTKWIQIAGEKQLTQEEAQQEFEKSKTGIRYQLIEGKLVEKYDIKIEFQDLKDFIREAVIGQFQRANMPVTGEDQIDGIVENVLKNQDEVRQISEQLLSQKLVSTLKENLTYAETELSSEEFIKKLYPQQA